jgi:hypothetical protein
VNSRDVVLIFQESSVMALKRKYIGYQGTVFLLLAAVLLSGCISLQSTPQDKPLPPLIPDPARDRTIETTAIPAATATPLPQQTDTTASPADILTTNLPYGITISYPRDWIMEETGVNVTRDYGRDVINIANFYSPAITPQRRDVAGPDKSRNTILTVDIDEAGVADFERYFNLVPFALRKEYGSIDITRHNLQLKISGYKSYQMDFDTDTLRGKYIFTNVHGTIYIFAFSNPTPYSSEVEAMYRSVIISP